MHARAGSGAPRAAGGARAASAAAEDTDGGVQAALKGVMDALAGDRGAAGGSAADVQEGLMRVPLMRHQRIALQWMLQREGSRKPKGGILADDQGLGKTVSTMSLLVATSADSRAWVLDALQDWTNQTAAAERGGDPAGGAPGEGRGRAAGDAGRAVASAAASTPAPPVKKGGTLVVCPTSILRQWARELNDKVSASIGLSVYVHHGSDRAKSPEQLCGYDVVLTTYALVVQETQGKGGSSSALGQVYWYRAVLDEAQMIKNAKTLGSQSCSRLWADRRWCLSGTPIQNSIEDLFSYFHFLRYEPYNQYQSFASLIRDEISQNPEKGYRRLQAVLSPVMLRRTKQSTLNGQPIINLPPRMVNPCAVDFSPAEKRMYAALHEESAQFLQQLQQQQMRDAGTSPSYVNMLCHLLRLRQACNHPWLVKGNKLKQERATQQQLGAARRLGDHYRAELLELVREGRAECPVCFDLVEDPVVTKCGHLLCRQCVSLHWGAGGDGPSDDVKQPCPACSEEVSVLDIFTESALQLEPGASAGRQVSQNDWVSSAKLRQVMTLLGALRNKMQPSNKRMKMSRTPSKGSDLAIAAALSPLPPPPPNPNMISCAPTTEKVVIFSQWTSMLDILEVPLKKEGYKYRRLDGSMSIAAREKAVNNFLDDPTVTVMIMSLKAASLGLNLAVANHVVLLDLWWNPTVEEQAIDRCHRIGQTRPVTVSKITVKGTVEDRISQLQEKKRKMVQAAFGESKFLSRAARLTYEDLKYLFG